MKELITVFVVILVSIVMQVTAKPMDIKTNYWLQGNHDEFQTNRVNVFQPFPDFNVSIQGTPNIYFDRNLVLVDASRNVLITNYALYDGEKFPQLDDFVLCSVDLTTGTLTKLNFDTSRPAFRSSSISHAVMSPQGVYYFALSRQQVGLNFVFTYNLTAGHMGYSNYYSIPNGVQVDGLTIVDNTLFVYNVEALNAYNLDMTLKWTYATGFTYGQASNLITTEEKGRKLLYYAAQNIVFRMDPLSFTLLRYQFPVDYSVKSVSYLGNGNLLVVVNDNSVLADRIFSVNVVSGISTRLPVAAEPELGPLLRCSNSMNYQAPNNPFVTYSVLVCSEYTGGIGERNVIGLSWDATNPQKPNFSVQWHLKKFRALDLPISATNIEGHFLLATDHGYMVMDMASGKMITTKQSNVANSSCKIVTAMNGKFYSVCTDTSTMRIASRPIY
ncbi:hypothetical protein C9374_013454 [Naegleria lovaniensis]|uniref:Uncharacterized protein n=1 Tax=Naegleria lovaniensis TaxID=51637 RepID=A0AA88H1E9_NAELO|nr:uncharacterized protein C9374_013454 [Naegleria lovaniensis]KAG2391969.1 hypothetical protein C9374_013454 [Naegleria lovaniensis]